MMRNALGEDQGGSGVALDPDAYRSAPAACRLVLAVRLGLLRLPCLLPQGLKRCVAGRASVEYWSANAPIQ